MHLWGWGWGWGWGGHLHLLINEWPAQIQKPETFPHNGRQQGNRAQRGSEPAPICGTITCSTQTHTHNHTRSHTHTEFSQTLERLPKVRLLPTSICQDQFIIYPPCLSHTDTHCLLKLHTAFKHTPTQIPPGLIQPLTPPSPSPEPHVPAPFSLIPSSLRWLLCFILIFTPPALLNPHIRMNHFT